MNFFSARKLGITAIALAIITPLVGCSKKVEAPTALATPVETAAAPVAAPVVRAQVLPSTDANKSFAEADAALKNNAYDKAAQALLAVQMQKNLSEQQAAEANKRMIGLQRGLADAIARGDASAKAAADLIRQAHMVR